MLLVKNWQLFHFFIFGKIGQKMFQDILERKSAFLDYRNKKFKVSKKQQQGLVHTFWSKISIFPSLYFR